MKTKKLLITTLVCLTTSFGHTQVGYSTQKKIAYPSSGTAIISHVEVEDLGAMPTDNNPEHPLGQSEINILSTSPIFTTKSITPVIGRNFGANNMAKGTPPDNFIAISNGGNIMSVDNHSSDYYTDTPDTIIQFLNTWDQFHFFSGLSFNSQGFYDPKCIYDKANDRFINVILNNGDSLSNSKLLISFSQSNNPDLSWNYYEIHVDSIFPNQNFWFDYPNIAVNNNELYITLNVYSTIDTSFQSNVLFQINKSEGYSNNPLYFESHTGITNIYGQIQPSLLPLSDAMQSNLYNEGCYLVATNGSNSSSLNWFKLTDNIDVPHSIVSQELTTTFYDKYNYASQPGGSAGDRINVGNCRVRSGYYQNGKLHFVYMRSNSAWGQIVYSKINISTNTEQRATYGSGSPNNYCFPSIAHFGNTNLIEDAMICFLKVGPNDYPSIGVINYDGSWGTETIVKQGVDVVNLRTYDGTPNKYERLGDYTQIQRRYNSVSPTCWLVGCYSFGSQPNLGGVEYGLNAWVAEIGDNGVGLFEIKNKIPFDIYPNPAFENEDLYIKFSDNNEDKSVVITNSIGEKIKVVKCDKLTLSIRLSNIAPGTYFVNVISKSKKYEIKKIIIH